MIRPADFNEISEKILSKIDQEEPSIRTSIGRKYYYLYLELRETIKVNVNRELRELLDEEYSREESLHCVLREVLFIISKRVKDKELQRQFKKAANAIKILRRLRNDSDYKLNRTISNQNLNNARYDVSDVEEILSKISQLGVENLTQYLQEAVEKCRKR